MFVDIKIVKKTRKLMKNISFIIIYCWYFNECTASKQEMKNGDS
ncbi:hypothetical protein J699_02537 [Acinetobacter sp. 1000160]|nr:hypothetical protein J522_3365 [Acinetobacter baumannii 146457]EYT18814.1 hypothetical protein J699_02537 [Acinetobacter sp. 1000160]